MIEEKTANLPPSFLDLFMLISMMFIIFSSALFIYAKDEYQTTVNLLKKKIELPQLQEMGNNSLSLAIIKEKTGDYKFVLESKKTGVKTFKNLQDVSDELSRLHPQELVMRVDQKAEFKYPQSVLVDAHNQGIHLSFAYQGGS